MADYMIQDSRKIRFVGSSLATFSCSDIGKDPISWLRINATEGMYLLAHADDGILWGQVAENTILLPRFQTYRQAELRSATLQMARLFNMHREVLLWRTAELVWAARILEDGDDKEKVEHFDEEQVLWGTSVDEVDGHFSLVTDGIQGLRHAFPANLPIGNLSGDHPLRLHVRHYLSSDQEGWRRIARSRLLDVQRQ